MSNDVAVAAVAAAGEVAGAADVGVVAAAPPAPVFVDAEFINGVQPSMAIAATSPEDRAATIREYVKTISKTEATSRLVVGGLLYEAQKGEYHKKYTFTDSAGHINHYADFKHWVMEETGMPYRTAFNRIKLYELLVVTLKLPAEQIKGLKLGNVEQLYSSITVDNAPDMLAICNNSTFSEVCEVRAMLSADSTLTPDTIKAKLDAARAAKLAGPANADAAAPATEGTAGTGGISGSGEQAKSIKFTGTVAQIEAIKSAITTAKQVAHTDSDIAAIELICAEFQASNCSSSGTPEEKMAAVMRILRNVEVTYGIRVQVLAEDGVDAAVADAGGFGE
jgi:hypothetical protein